MENISFPMANLSKFIIVLIVLVFSFVVFTTGEDSVFGVEMDRELIMSPNQEKLSHFRFYWHDIFTGKYPSGVFITSPANSSKAGFGAVRMIDNPLTIAPDVGSKMVGRAQGFYALASQEEIGALMTMNFIFTEGRYKYSTITIVGWNSVLEEVREMPVVGGSGLFRWARGYAQATTQMYHPETGDAIVEYNVYVVHY